MRWPHILTTYIFDAMLKFIALFLLFLTLGAALAVILLALTKRADDRYWSDVKKYYEDENNNENQS